MRIYLLLIALCCALAIQSCKNGKEKQLIGKWEGTNNFSCGDKSFPYDGSAKYEFNKDGICVIHESFQVPTYTSRTFYYKVKGDSITFSGNQNPEETLTSYLKFVSNDEILIISRADTCAQTLKLKRARD